MSDEDEIPHFDSQDELDHPMKVLAVLKTDDSPEGSLEERLVAGIRTHGAMNDFFDDFDEKIAIPNEGHIKYEVGSDGLVVILADNEELFDKVVKFIDDVSAKLEEEDEEDAEDDERDEKRRK